MSNKAGVSAIGDSLGFGVPMSMVDPLCSCDLACFTVVAVFFKLPAGETLRMLKCLLDSGNISVVEHVVNNHRCHIVLCCDNWFESSPVDTRSGIEDGARGRCGALSHWFVGRFDTFR